MANNLKELTRQHHDNAERTEFADMLLSGQISPKLYQEYLHAQLQNYMVLESAVEVPMELEPIFRSTLIEEDLQELESTYELEEIEDNFESVVEYINIFMLFLKMAIMKVYLLIYMYDTLEMLTVDKSLNEMFLGQVLCMNLKTEQN